MAEAGECRSWGASRGATGAAGAGDGSYGDRQRGMMEAWATEAGAAEFGVADGVRKRRWVVLEAINGNGVGVAQRM